MLIFYHTPMSCSTASHIALEEPGQDYVASRIRLYKPEEHEVYKRDVNPLGTVPALQTARGLLTENMAIMYYLASLKPELRLLPTEAYERARCLSFLSWVGSSVQIARRQFKAPVRFTSDESAFSALSTSGAEKFRACVERIDQRLSDSHWIMGDQYTVADGYALVVFHWAVLDELDMTAYPHFSRHLRNLLDRPAVCRALADERCVLLDTK